MEMQRVRLGIIGMDEEEDQRRMELMRKFVREEYAEIDPSLPNWLEALRKAGASECFHKHGTFYEHLLGVYRILKLWGAPSHVAACGLLHSAYSNSYVNLAIFKPGIDRSVVADLIGSSAEQLVELFCIVPRHQLIHDMLLFRISDDDLINKLEEGKKSFRILPEGYTTVKNIRTGEDLRLPRRLVAIFVLLTMADFADQLYSWQDVLFDNRNGKLEFSGNNYSAIWPGDVKPGLWMSALSRMALLFNVLLKEGEEEEEGAEAEADYLKLEMALPPIFDRCSKLLKPKDQEAARDLYVEAVAMKGSKEESERMLVEACQRNPWIAEAHLGLAQMYCEDGRFEMAQHEAKCGLKLLIEWGSVWDKRMSWEGWISWARVLLLNANNCTWPTSSWGIINLGLVA